VAVTCAYDERMVIKTPDFSVLDPLWEKYNKSTYPLEKIALPIMRDLARLNPQGHVHAEELYSAVNVVKRCPPQPSCNSSFPNRGHLIWEISTSAWTKARLRTS